MISTCDIAVVGATGAVGEAMLTILGEREFPVGKLYPLAGERSAGDSVMFRNRAHRVENLEGFDFTQVQMAFFSAGNAVSAEYVPRATAAGCVVIDNTSCFRYQDDIPLIIPEVNPEMLRVRPDCNIIANPNCSTIQMLVVLKPLHDVATIRRITVSTYQAVSGVGMKGVEALAKQTTCLLNAGEIETDVFSRQIAFNVIPHIDRFEENGYTREEMKMVWETRKILDDETIQVNPTCVRVPVFYGHSESVSVETESRLSAADARDLLEEAPGVAVVDEPAAGGYPTPVNDCSGKDEVFVGRIREDISCEQGLNLWIVSDNVRKGAALNSIQIAELLIKSPMSL